MAGAFGPSMWVRAVDGATRGRDARVRDAASQMTYEQLMQATGTPSRMSARQMSEMDAETDRKVADADALHADSMAKRAEIMEGYAPYTRSLQRDADVLDRRNDRAEAAMRGELGPRAPQADPSGPYYRDSTGRPYDGRVNGMYDILTHKTLATK
jgi:hypothetical protein